MSEERGIKPWLWVLAGTVIGGVLVGIILFALEGPVKGFGKHPEKRLSYAITEVRNIYRRPPETNLVVQLIKGSDKLPVENMWGYRVKIWNSGSEPLNDLPVEFHLSTESSFYCLAEQHSAQPKDLIGAISDVSTNAHGVRTFKYQYLNSDYSDEVFFVVNQPCDIRVVARGPNLLVQKEVIKARTWTSRFVYVALVIAIGVIVGAVLEMLGRLRKLAGRIDLSQMKLKDAADEQKVIAQQLELQKTELQRFLEEQMKVTISREGLTVGVETHRDKKPPLGN
jgi:hypothetical protein